MTQPPPPPGPPPGQEPGPPPGGPERGSRRTGRWEAPPGAPPVPVPAHQTGPAPPPAGQSPYGARPTSTSPHEHVGHSGYGQFTFPQMRKAKVDPLAVAGLVTAILGLPGLVLGLLSRPRVKDGRRRSPALAWTAIVLGTLFTIGWTLTFITLVLTGTFDRLTEQPQAGDVDAPRTIATATLAPGNCILTLPPAREVGEVRVVPCAQMHIAQVVSAHPLAGDYAGQEELEAQAEQTCNAEVEGLEEADQVIPWYLIPTEEGWQEGNTQFLCLARGATGPFEGDLLT